MRNLQNMIVRAGWCLILVLLPSCTVLEKHKIKQILDGQVRALKEGDAQNFLAAFAPDYEDPWLSLDQARRGVEEQLGKRPLPLVNFEPPEIEIKDNRAVVSHGFSLEAQLAGRTRRYQEVEHLVFERKKDEWLCRRGSKLLRLLAGQMEEEYAIEQILLRREAALVNRDLDAMMSLISPNYRHRGNGPDELKKNVFLPIFQVYDHITFRSYNRTIWFFGNTATVQQSFTMQTNLLGTPKTFSGEERFELEKTDDGWKFTKGF